MSKQRGGIVAITEDAARQLGTIAYISNKITRIGNQHFIVASRTTESINYLDIVLMRDSPSDLSFSLLLPHRFVQYILSGQTAEKILGVQRN